MKGPIKLLFGWCTGLFFLILQGGCFGSYSNIEFEEDAEFISALPTRELMNVDVPDGGAGEEGMKEGIPGPIPAVGDASEYYLFTLQVSSSLNSSIFSLLDFIELVISYPPTMREENIREWGPYDIKEGYTFLLHIERGNGKFSYYIELSNDAMSAQIMTGDHRPEADAGEMKRGEGSFTFDFGSFGEISGNGQSGVLAVSYDTAGEKVEMEIKADGVIVDGNNVPDYEYYYFEDPEMNGEFFFGFFGNIVEGEDLEYIEIESYWLSTGAGKGDGMAEGGDLESFEFSGIQCWDENFKTVYYQDNLGTEEGDPDECAL